MITKFKKSKKSNPQRTLLFSIIIGLLIFGVIGFLVISNWRINQKRAELISQIETLRKEIEILAKKNQELREEILQAEKEIFLEKKARERLGLRKPGEEVIVVLPPEEKEGQVKEVKEKSFWEKILEKLKFFR